MKNNCCSALVSIECKSQQKTKEGII